MKCQDCGRECQGSQCLDCQYRNGGPLQDHEEIEPIDSFMRMTSHNPVLIRARLVEGFRLAALADD